MIVSPKHKIVFLQIPKCGSISLEVWAKENMPDCDLFLSSKDKKASQMLIDDRHCGITSLNQNKGHIHDTNDWLYFAISRNPYDRLVSGFYHCKESFGNFANYDFEQFVKKMRFVNVRTHFQPQFSWDCIKLTWMKLENIEEEFKWVQTHTGIHKPLMKHNKTKTRGKLGWEAHYDDEMKKIVYDYYKRDFELLGYDK